MAAPSPTDIFSELVYDSYFVFKSFIRPWGRVAVEIQIRKALDDFNFVAAKLVGVHVQRFALYLGVRGCFMSAGSSDPTVCLRWRRNSLRCTSLWTGSGQISQISPQHSCDLRVFPLSGDIPQYGYSTIFERFLQAEPRPAPVFMATFWFCAALRVM